MLSVAPQRLIPKPLVTALRPALNRKLIHLTFEYTNSKHGSPQNWTSYDFPNPDPQKRRCHTMYRSQTLKCIQTGQPLQCIQIGSKQSHPQDSRLPMTLHSQPNTANPNPNTHKKTIANITCHFGSKRLLQQPS
eukprot:381489_1